ncbi:MAG: hypothetical protein ACI80K_001851 [Paracoccaceae bacterium]
MGAWTPFARPFGSTLSIQSGGATGRSASAAAPLSVAALRGIASDVERLGDAVRQLARLDRVQSRSVGARAGVARGELVIDDSEVQPTAATMRSVEEVNTVATSYSTHEPGWAGASAASATVDGIYDGSQGDSALQFEVTGVPILGLGDTEIEVSDGAGTVIDTLTFSASGGTQSLSNGLELTLDAGSVSLGDTFTLDAFASVGTSVRAGAAFNGTGDARPEFDPGRAVTAGTFQLNGVSVDVAADDSILDVLETINRLGTGVTAQFDAASESILLTQDSGGSEPTILFGSDTSGFLNAVKLSGATAEHGEDAGAAESLDDRLSELRLLDGVISGSFQVNGATIDVDVDADTLADVLARIQAATGVNSAVASDGTVTLSGEGRRAFELSNDDTGLFEALGIDLQRYSGRRGRQTTRIANREGVRQAIHKVHDAYNALLRGPREGVSATNVREVRSRLSTAVGGVFSSQLKVSGSGELLSGLGLNLTKFDDAKTRAMELDSVKMSKALRSTDGELSELLFGAEDGRRGLVEALQLSVEGAGKSLLKKLGAAGALGLRLDVTG